MTPEERNLIADLFDRLAQLERNPRDADAERTIREGLQRAPNAIYALVQSVLVQDEALRAANDHIADLEDELNRGGPGGQGGRDERPRSFLDGVRDTVFGRDDQPRGGGSVPSVGRDRPMGAPAGYSERRDNPGNPWGQARDAGPGYAGGPGGPGGPGYGGPGGAAMGGGGGGFLGTAAAVAAGAIGSSLLMGGIRSALGSQSQGGQSTALGGALDHLRGGGGAGGKADPNSSLAQDAGLGDVGRGGRTNTAQADRKQDEDQDQDDQQDEDDQQDAEQDGDFDDDDFQSDDDDN